MGVGLDAYMEEEEGVGSGGVYKEEGVINADNTELNGDCPFLTIFRRLVMHTFGSNICNSCSSLLIFLSGWD